MDGDNAAAKEFTPGTTLGARPGGRVKRDMAARRRRAAATRADAYCRLPPEQGAQNVGTLHGGAGLQSVGRRSRSLLRMRVRREALPVDRLLHRSLREVRAGIYLLNVVL